MKTMNPDVVVIGGGVIGAAVAYGLAAQKASVVMLDREDFQLTASRGNFGLVWLQGKGHGMRSGARKPRNYGQTLQKSLRTRPVFPSTIIELVASKFVWERKNTVSEVHSSKRCEPNP